MLKPRSVHPRGINPYANIPATGLDPLHDRPSDVPDGQWRQFFKYVTGDTWDHLRPGLFGVSMIQALEGMVGQLSLWRGFNTEPLPMPIPDLTFDPSAIGMSYVTPKVVRSVAARTQLNGLGDTGDTPTTFPLKNLPANLARYYSGDGVDNGDGTITLWGNTNGWPAPSVWDFLNYAVHSNGKIYASKAWAQGGPGSGLNDWNMGFSEQQRTMTRIADIAAITLAAVGGAYALAPSAAGAGGASAAGTGADLAAAEAPTGEVAGQLSTTDLLGSSSLLTPVTAAGAGSTLPAVGDIFSAAKSVIGAGLTAEAANLKAKAAHPSPTPTLNPQAPAAAQGAGKSSGASLALLAILGAVGFELLT